MRVAIAFADLAGYTRLTEEAGRGGGARGGRALRRGRRRDAPRHARVIKTIGDEVMVVGTDASALCDWAVGLLELSTERPLPRIGVHVGSALYRDGDYYGRAVNLAARVGARATGGEVLVTREVRDAAGRHLSFQPIGEVKLKGFGEATELFLGGRGDERDREGGSCCSPAGATRSACCTGCATRAVLRAARQLRAARASPTTTRRSAARCARASACGFTCARRRAGRATCRRGRGSCATPRRERLAGDGLIAAGHTATDQLETLIYRLAASPGPARAARHGRRARLAPAAGHDAGGDGGVLPRPRPAVARGRLEPGVRTRTDPRTILPALRQLHPTRRRTCCDARSCARRGSARRAGRHAAWRRSRRRGGAGSTALAPAAARRLVLQRLAGGAAASLATHAEAIVALATRRERLARPARRSARHLRVRARQDRSPAPTAEPMPARLPIPGRVAFGAGVLVSERGPFAIADGTLAEDALAPRWRSAPGARATGCARSGSAAASRCRTCSPTARSRASAPPAARRALRRRDRVGARGGDGRAIPGPSGHRARVRLAWLLDSAAP